MNLSRLAIVIWFFLPISVYWISRYRRARLIRKLPSTTYGTVVDISYHYGFGESDFISTNLTYKINVKGIEYSGQGFWGAILKPGDEVPIPIRYHPERPEESVIDHHMTTAGWVIMGFFFLAIDLGYAFLSGFIGLLTILAGIRLWPGHLTQLQLIHFRTVLLSLLCILTGLPFVAIGIISLITHGFLDQNILRTLWNH